MYINAGDWVERFKAAGCKMDVDAVTMRPGGRELPDECVAMWAEIHGPQNRDKSVQVEARVRELAGAIQGWITWPPD